MTKNEAYKKAIESLTSDNMANDFVQHNILREDYNDALDNISEALDYYEDTDDAADHGWDHEWADSRCWDARTWAQVNPGLLDVYFEEAINSFGMDVLTTDGMTPIPASAMLHRIYEISCYAYYMAVWNVAMWAVQDEAESYDYDEYHNIVRSDG